MFWDRKESAALVIQLPARGMTLLEVLVSLSILAIGLLGMMSLQVNALQGNQVAYYRTQAVFLGSDIAEKIHANPRAAEDGDYNTGNSALVSAPDCSNGNCTHGMRAVHDLVQWNLELADRLPEGRGIVCADGSPGDGTWSDPDCDTNPQPDSPLAIKIFWNEKTGDESRHALAIHSR